MSYTNGLSFNDRRQGDGETFARYILLHCASIQSIVILKTVRRDIAPEQMLRDRIVCGIRDARLREVFFSRRNHTLQESVDQCEGTKQAAHRG